jgi:putative tryptophan/tyrosine transport system substrate-binding protein
MRRREVLSLLGGALVSWPVSWPKLADANYSDRLHQIGVLIGLSENDPDVPPRIAVFEQALRELGWSKGRNILIHYRFAVDLEQLKAGARELTGLQPDLVVAGSSFVVSALLEEACAAPIVFVSAANPIGNGFVTALQRPGGNLTGFTNSVPSMGGKMLELLKEVAPRIARITIMFNPETASGSMSQFVPSIEAAAASITVQPLVVPVRSAAEIEGALAEIGRDPAHGLVTIPDNFMSIHRALVVERAARFKVPAVYPARYFATDGGLMSCGADLLDLYRRTPSYVDRILRGSKPADLPVQAPAKLDLVINLKAAEALGLSVPRIMIARASEVIE